MKKILNVHQYYYYIFLAIYFVFGIYFSLNIGITIDEPHSNWVWELNKKKISNIFFKTNHDLSYLDTYHGYYGIGFYIISTPLEQIFSLLIKNKNINTEGSILLLKHPTVFIFFFISGIFFKKIIILITKDKLFSNLSTIFYLTYPYILGHSFFNVKDIPFMSIWLISTFYLIKNLNEYFFKTKIKIKNLCILALSTAYLLSLRINGILIFLEYFIFLIVYLNVFKKNFFIFIKEIKKEILIFFTIIFLVTFILYPSFWTEPGKYIDSINFFGQIIQTVCTITLGECMETQNLPSTYLFIWLFFKLPILLLFGILLFPFIEKKLFNDKKNSLIIASLLLTVFSIIVLFVFLKINLYDEVRQILFLIPLIFLISLSLLFYFKKKLSILFLSFYIVFFIVNNFKIFPYNYLWLNNFNVLINVNKNFEKDYWGVSTREITKYFNTKSLKRDTCIISTRNDGIKYFLKQKDICFKPFKDLHKKNKRPFYVALIERTINKGLPNNCNLRHSYSTKINFSKEDIVVAKIYECS